MAYHDRAIMRAPIAFASIVLFCFFACGSPPEPKSSVDVSGQCPTTGSRECKQSSDCVGNGMHCSGGRCFANHVGCPCTNPDDCGSLAHCTKETCYQNAAGQPCSQPSDCGEHAHCMVDTCYANAAGSPCSGADTECGPGSKCVGGTCN